MPCFVVIGPIATKLIYEIFGRFRSMCELRMTLSSGFEGSFFALFLVKPFCYLRENLAGGISTPGIMVRPLWSEVVFMFGWI